MNKRHSYQNNSTFVAFIALILRNYIANLPKLKSDLKKQNLTVQEVLLELEKIKLTTIMPLTSIQKNILETYGIADDMNKVIEII